MSAATKARRESRPNAAVRLISADVRPEPLGSWTELVHTALESEDTERFLAAAARALGRPVGLVGPTGRILGHAPTGPGGRRALAVAAAAGTRPAAPAGWRVIQVVHAGTRLGVLAVAAPGAAQADEPLLDLITTLLGEQLTRASLLQAQTAALLGRLVCDPGMGPRRARRDAAALGLTLADAYWPAVLVWEGAPPPAPTVERIEREARSLVSGGLTATLGGQTVLLHPGGDVACDPVPWFGQVVERARAEAPTSRAHAIAAEEAAELAQLSAEATKLESLSGLRPRAGKDRPVISAREYALDHLLMQVAGTADAQRFVEDRLATLTAWDREHGSDLLRVLEAALDFPRHDQAASQCYMHRNTFRHRLRLAMRLLGDRLEDPSARLAVHVALKLRGVLGASE